jgi:acyl carrier protein
MTPTAQEIQDWMVARVANLAGVAPEEIDVRAPLSRHGLDSVALVVLAADLEKWLGYRFRENPLESHPTIESLAQFLGGQVARERSKGQS